MSHSIMENEKTNRTLSKVTNYHQSKEFQDLGNSVKSNLPLQILLYFNIWFFPIWFIVILINLDVKQDKLSEIYKFTTAIVFVVITIFECTRLYMGYIGNLSEKIPELASFWLISILIQLPLELFALIDKNMKPDYSESIVSGIMILFLILEIFTGVIAIKTFANHHVKQFYIAQLYGVSDRLN